MRLKSDNPILPGSPRPCNFASCEVQFNEVRHNLLGKCEHGNNVASLIFYVAPEAVKSVRSSRLADVANVRSKEACSG